MRTSTAPSEAHADEERALTNPHNAGELASLCNLERLNLAFNPLVSRSPELPEVIFKVTTLVELNLDYTGIQVIRVDPWNPSRTVRVCELGTTFNRGFDRGALFGC
jgi:hypothetical protein